MAPPEIFAPAKLGPVSLRNRVIKAATFEGASPQGRVSDFHRAVARGGVAATTVAYLAVSPQGRTHRDQICLCDPSPRRRPEARHRRHPRRGAAAVAQLGHAGPVANGRSNGARALSASRMPSPLSMQMVRAAKESDLQRVALDYEHGARRAVAGGFDVLEIHLGHGYLLSSFLSPNLNRRKDSRGGGLSNRASFPREVVGRVRDAVGGGVAVTAKISMTDGVRGGFGVDESIQLARLLQDHGALDALQLSAGSSLLNPMYLFRGDAPRRQLAAVLPQPVRTGMRLFGKGFLREYPYEEAFLLPHARRFRQALTMPLTPLGGITTRATLDLAMAEGFEYAAMARALLREPDLVHRLQTGEATGSLCDHNNQCMPTIYSGTRCVLVAEAS